MEAEGDSKCNVDAVTSSVTNISQPPSPSTKEVHENKDNNHLEVNSPAVGNNEDPITLSSSSSQNPFISQTDTTSNMDNNRLEVNSPAVGNNEDPITLSSSSSQNPFVSQTNATSNTDNNHLEVNSPAVGNNEDPITLSSSSSQIPFISQTDATSNTVTGSVTGNMNSDTSNTGVSDSLDEKTNTNNNDSDGAFESLQNQQLTRETISSNVESHNPIQETEEECQGVNSSTTHLGTSPFPTFGSSDQEHVHASIDVTDKETPDLEFASHANGESSNADIPISSMPNHEHSDHVAGQNSTPNLPSQDIEHDINNASIDVTNKETPNLELASHANGESSNADIPISSVPNHEHSDHVAGQNSTPNSPSQDIEHDINKEADIQNPQVQVMERPNESGATSQYVFPSHVFARNNTNTPEWSTASNESLFSIYMGNMSFSSELACFKSCELDKPGDVTMLDQPNTSLNQPNTSTNHQPPASTSPNHQPRVPTSKFNDISQRTAELHEEGLKMTEAKAAETMREVIMESSRTTENVVKREDIRSCSRRQSDGSTNSYAFQNSKGRDKNLSSKGAGEKQTQQKMSDQNEKTKGDDQEAKPNTNAPPNKWLSCFSCCTFC